MKMAKRSRKTQKSKSRNNLKGYVSIALVEDAEQAKDYETLLKNEDIPAVVKERKDPQLDDATGYAVMVPESLLDEAYAAIETQFACDDFYDFTSADDDYGDNGEFEDEIFDDDDNY
jgi:hypothetical protein